MAPTRPIATPLVWLSVATTTTLTLACADDSADASFRLSSAPQVYFPFDEASGSTATDRGGAAKNGTLTQMNLTSAWVTGPQGSALRFDGIDDHLVVAGGLQTLLGGTASISCYLQTTQTGNDTFWQAPGLTGVEQYGGEDDVFWGWLDGSGRIGVQAGNGPGAKSSNPVNDGAWHHVVMTRDASTGRIELYLDGVLQGSAIAATGTMTTAFGSLGRIEDTGGSPSYFRGSIDELRIFGTVLTAADVAELSGQGTTSGSSTGGSTGGSTGSSTGGSSGGAGGEITEVPVMHLRLDEGSGTTASDASGNGRSATLTNLASSAWITGKKGGALRFDGADDHLATSFDLGTWLNGTATLSAWVRTSARGNDTFWQAPGLTGVEQYGGGNDVFWGWLDGSGRIGLQAGDGNSARSTRAINDGAWHHVALTRDASTGAVRVYVDGVLEGSATSATGIKTTAFRSLGRIEDTSGSPAYWPGDLDDLRIYAKVLVASDIATLAGTSTGGGGPTCATGELACGTTCVDPQTDEANCGACGASCTGTQTCQSGACVSPPPPSGGDPFSHGSLQVSPDGHSLRHADGTPFFMQGDTGWLLLWKLNANDATSYLQQRAQAGYNTVLAMVAATYADRNAEGQTSFVNGDKSRPNEDFFRNVDTVLSAAETRGIYLGLVAAWGNSSLGADNDFGSSARPYGVYLGNRYKNRPNVIWVLGGDTTGGLSVYQEILAGIRSTGDTHLATWHPSDCCSSRDVISNSDPLIHFNLVQTGHSGRDISPSRVSDDYNATPARPTLNSEPNYEHHPINWNSSNGYFNDLDVRRQAYWSVFAGAAGHVYGSHSVWQFWRPGDQPTFGFLGAPEGGIAWWDAVNDDGSMDMQHVKRLVLSRPYFDRKPDTSILAAGQGSGGDLVTASRDASGRFAMVYFPSQKAVTLDLTKVGGPTVKTWWYDPRTGQATSAGNFANTGTRAFTPPGALDWVLVLDDADLGYGTPGQ